MNEARLYAMMFLASSVSAWDGNLSGMRAAVLLCLAVGWFLASLARDEVK